MTVLSPVSQNFGMRLRYPANHLQEAERTAQSKIEQGIAAEVVADLEGVSVLTNEELPHLNAFRDMRGSGEDYMLASQARRFFATFTDYVVNRYASTFQQNQPSGQEQTAPARSLRKGKRPLQA